MEFYKKNKKFQKLCYLIKFIKMLLMKIIYIFIINLNKTFKTI